MKGDIFHDPLFLAGLKKGGAGGSASGDIVTFNAPKAAPLRSLRIAIDPVQDLHGYDSPWPGGGGKNKFNVDAIGNSTYITVSNGVITVSGNSRNPSKKLSDLADLVVGETYVLTASTTGTANYIYLTTPAESWYFGQSRTISQNDLNSNVLFYAGGADVTANISAMMIRLSSVSDASYAPYSNLCPISGWDEANLWRTGKNVLELTAEKMTSVGWNREFPISVKAGNYVISCENQFGPTGSSNYGASVSLKGSDDTAYATLTNYAFGDTLFSKAFTISSSWANKVTKIVFAMRASGTTFEDIAAGNIQLELGSTASPYEPYTGNQITIQLGQTVYGGTLDVVNGVLTVDRVADTFTKDSAWYGFSTGTENSSAVVQLTEYQNCRFVDGVSSRNGAVSSTGKEAANYWVGARQNEIPPDGDMCFAYSSTGQLRFHRLDVSNITDLESFKAAFPDTVVCYYLATPITIPLSDITISTLAGQNVMWADCGDVAVEWAGGKGFGKEAMLAWVMHR